MNRYQMQLKMQYEVKVIEMLCTDLPQRTVLELVPLYSRYMAEMWERHQSIYETARFIQNDNLHLVSVSDNIH
jgi:purine-nucleoside phosphorylase